MKKHLQVSFKIGNRQEVWIQHPDLSRAIHANERGTGDISEVMEIADRLAHKLGSEFGDDIELELNEIHDGKKAYDIELWDYNNGAELIKHIDLETA